MNPSGVLGCLAVLFSVLAASATATAQTSLERGRYLVDTVMTCHNCHTPRGPKSSTRRFPADRAASCALALSHAAYFTLRIFIRNGFRDSATRSSASATS
jgi:cytochrome c553